MSIIMTVAIQLVTICFVKEEGFQINLKSRSSVGGLIGS